MATSVPTCAVIALEIELPLPTLACSSNSGAGQSRDYITKNAGAQAYKEECLAHLPCFHVPLFQRARIDRTFYLGPSPGRCHPRDQDNAVSCSKWLTDSLVDCGLLPGDSDRYLELGSVKLLSKQADHGGRACVVVRLERIA